jgi:hypothetical protein
MASFILTALLELNKQQCEIGLNGIYFRMDIVHAGVN